MKTAIIIPSRMASTRLPGKPLVGLVGADGKTRSLIERCWNAAKAPANRLAAECYVATDHPDIAEHVRGFGGKVVMTSQNCRNGTERVARAAEEIDADIFINFQGDAPLIPADFVETVASHIQSNNVDMATPVMACSAEILANLREDRRQGQVGGTTAVFTTSGRAIYFSKEVLPISDGLNAEEIYLHIGLYAYRRQVLQKYLSWEPTRLEQIEGLEQLRFLENGARVDCVKVEANGRAFWEVNLAEDIPRVEKALRERGID